MAEGITSSINNLLKLVQSISGIEMSIAGVVNNVNALNTKMLQVTYNLGAFSKGFDDVSSQVNTLSDRFKYTQGAVASMVETLGTGFRKPITDMGEIELILKRSQALFGSNEAAAAQFIDQLAKMDQTAGPLRDTYRELQELIQKNDQGSATAEEIKRMEVLKDLSEAELLLKLADGEITLKQYNQTMATMQAESDMSQKSVEARKNALALSHDINKAQSATITANQIMMDFMNNNMDTVGKFMGGMVSGGSVVVSEGLKFIASGFSEYAKEGEKGLQRLLAKDNAGGKALQEAIKEAQDEYGKDIDESKIKEKMKAGFVREGEGKVSEADAQKLVDIYFKEVEARDAVKDAIIQTQAASKAYASEDEKQTKNINQEKALTANKIKYLGEEYRRMSGILSSQADSLLQIEVLNARAGKSYNYSEAYSSGIKFQESLNKQRENLQSQIELQKKINEEAAKKIASAQTDKDRENAIKIEERGRAALLRMQGELNSLVDQQLARNNAINAGFEKRASFIRAELDYQKQVVSLQDSFAVGISANAAAREKVAKLAIEEAENEKKRIAALQVELASMKQAGAEAGAIKEQEKQITEAKTKHLSLVKEALDATQKMREGYLDAIDSMQSGAGIFTEIVADQNKSLGALVRTTEEMPRVLRTGAGSGGILEAGQFGPGGISGGFDPNSPEYAKHVLRNMDDVQSLLSEMPGQIGESVGNHLGWAAKGREEFGGQIAEAAKPGEAGEIKSTYPSIPSASKAPGSPPTKGSLEDLVLRVNKSFDELSEEEKQAYRAKEKELEDRLEAAYKQKKGMDSHVVEAKKKEETTAPESKKQSLSLSKEEEEKIRKQIEELDKEYMEAMKQVDEINQSAQYIRDIGRKANEDDPLFEGWVNKGEAQAQEAEEYRSKAMRQNVARRKDIEERRKKALERLGGGQDIQQVVPGGSGSPDTGGKAKQETTKTEEPVSQKTYTAQEHKEALNAMVAQVSHEIHIGVVNAVRMGMSKAMKELANSTA